MQKPFMRIPYTGALPPPVIWPPSASNINAAVAALVHFFRGAQSRHHATPSALQSSRQTPVLTSAGNSRQTALITGAGISVASGLADYRGIKGTYTLNQSYRPIYFHEFCESHEARKRYWARSFLGWTNLNRSRPNAAHEAVGALGSQGWISSVITQNVDSFHARAHPDLPSLELHGYLRSLVCLTCRQEHSRADFQAQLARLNPAWTDFLTEMLRTGALETENPTQRAARGLRANPDGDVEVPNAPYTTFRYPACPACLSTPPMRPDGAGKVKVNVDQDGAWLAGSEGGILKPAVIMFGESIPHEIKAAAETAIDSVGRLLVVGSSLATYSAWRLVKRARDQGMPIGVLNMGGVRGEEAFFADITAPGADESGVNGVRCSLPAEEVLPLLAEELGQFH